MVTLKVRSNLQFPKQHCELNILLRSWDGKFSRKISYFVIFKKQKAICLLSEKPYKYLNVRETEEGKEEGIIKLAKSSVIKMEATLWIYLENYKED